MPELTVRTRYAPSPTGFMHVGNLRTALYEYLVAKSQNGKFILRIEDTDRERLVDGAVDVIYNTLKLAGLQHDEGPDLGGDFGPYVQSERKDMYLPYAEQLIKEGKAYRCFCSKERLEKIQNETVGGGYDRHCRDLPQEEIDRLLAEGVPYVIRQKMPMIATACVMTVLFVFSFILAVSGCETDIFVVMMMWKYNKSKHHYAGHRKKRYCCKFPDHPNLIFCTNIIDENGLCKGFHRFL